MAGGPIRVAVAGTGFYSQCYLDAWRRIEGVDLVGLCDVVPAKAAERAQRFGVARTFADYARMPDGLRPELVDIVTPQDAHPAQVAEAVRRGLTTVCQKPLARDLAKATAMVCEARDVFARLRRVNPAIAGEDAGYVVFEFAGGATGLFDGDRLNDHVATNPRLTMGEMWLEGSGGVLRLDGAGRLWLKLHGGPEAEHRFAWTDAGPGGDSVLAFQRHVVDYLRTGAPLETRAEDYLANIAVEEAVYRSNAEGRWVGVEMPAL